MTDLAPEIFDGHLAIVGRTGSGKSFTARGIVERWLSQGERVCIVDPTDVWFGLRSNAAGDGPGFPVVIFGGEHADVPLGERSGERVAEIIAERNLPAVIVTAEMTGGERHRFMSDFLGTLYRKNKVPLHLVLDEADDVAPQNPLPENRRMLGDVDRIVRRGRVKGFRVVFITQRPAVLHKNVLTQASTLIAMRLPAPQDRKAIEEWIKGQADVGQATEVLGSLSRLGRGEGWVWAPDHGVLQRLSFPLISTFDSMRTPEHGETIGEPTTLAPVELGDLRALMQVEREAAGDAGAPSSEAIEAAERRGLERGIVEGRCHEAAAQAEWRREAEAAMRAALGYLAPYVGNDGGVPVIDVRRPVAPTIDAEPAQAAVPAARPRRQPRTAPALDGGSKISAPQQRILDALAWLSAAGIDPASRTQVAFLAGYSPTGGGFGNYLGNLRTAGMISYPSGGEVALTGDGTTQARAPTGSLTSADLHATLRGRLGAAKWSILQRIIGAYPGAIGRDQLAADTRYSPTGGGFGNYLGALRSLGLIDYPGRGMVKAEPILFIDKRPRAVGA